jgi:hypothetical protein
MRKARAMSFTFDAAILFSMICLVGIVEFAQMCHLAPVAPEGGLSED